MAQVVLGELLKQKMMEKAAKSAGDMKDAVAGGLESALKQVKSLVASTAWPAISKVHGKMVSDTMEGKTQLMMAIMTLIKTDGFQKSYKDLIWCVDQILNMLTYFTKQITAFTATVESWRQH